MDEEVAREKAREEFEKTKHEKETKDEERTRKNREKREKKRKAAEMAVLKKKQEEWSRASDNTPGEGGNGNSGDVVADGDNDKKEDANESAKGKGETEDAETNEPLATASSPAKVSGPIPHGDEDEKTTERQPSERTAAAPAAGDSTVVPAPTPAHIAQPGLLIIEDDDD